MIVGIYVPTCDDATSFAGWVHIELGERFSVCVRIKQVFKPPEDFGQG